MTQRGRADVIFGIGTGKNTGKVFGIGLSWRVRRGGVILSEQTEQYMNHTVYEPHGTVYVAHSMFTSICSTQYMLNTAQYMNQYMNHTVYVPHGAVYEPWHSIRTTCMAAASPPTRSFTLHSFPLCLQPSTSQWLSGSVAPH